jgi:hypothetical protein
MDNVTLQAIVMIVGIVILVTVVLVTDTNK